MAPKVGDIVFAKTYDVYSEESQTRPGIVTKVYDEEDGEWAKDREIVSLVLFGGGSAPEEIDMDRGTTDDNGEREPGGWFDSYDDATSAPDVTTQTVEPDRVGGGVGVGSLGASANDPAALPGTTSGATTQTIGDGSDTASVTQPT